MRKNNAITFCEEPLGVGDFEGLPSGGETILLDDESLEVMYGIQETMRTLEPKGLDDIRTLRIETIGRRKSIVWYEVSIRIYKDVHGLSLSSEQGESYYFANKDNWIREENPVRHNCKHFLERLWGYLCAVVQQIARDPQSYTRYLEEHVPYQEREGHVVRGRILDVLPGIRIEAFYREQMIDLLQKKREAPAGGYKAMTLRQYIEAWKVAYLATTSTIQRMARGTVASSDIHLKGVMNTAPCGSVLMVGMCWSEWAVSFVCCRSGRGKSDKANKNDYFFLDSSQRFHRSSLSRLMVSTEGTCPFLS